MSSMELQMLLKAGEALFDSLEQETLSCLQHIEAMPAQEIERFVFKRQEILSSIQKFDTALNIRLKQTGYCGEESSLEKFRERQSFLLRRVIEADGLLLALAEIELASLNAKQAGISRGRCALNGYREEGLVSESSLKRVA
jgi:hypothetical protein